MNAPFGDPLVDYHFITPNDYKPTNYKTDMNQMTYAILLEDRKGYRETGLLKDFTKWAVGKSYTEKLVLAGNLLQTLLDEEIASSGARFEPPLNYKVLSDSTTRLYCKPAWVHPLTTRQKELLLGVNSINDRAEVFRNVDWVELLKEGSRVFVKVPYIDYPVRSAVHYIGRLSGETGIRFGVEFLDKDSRSLGATNGVFKGYQYFQCEQDCGMFVSMDKLVLHNPSPITQEPKPSDNKPLNKGDKVTTYDDEGNPVRGTVQWIGRNKDVAPDGKYIVGIYTDDFIVNINKRFQTRIGNMDHMIQPSTKHTRLFLPIDCFLNAGSQESNNVSHKPMHGHDTRHVAQNRSYAARSDGTSRPQDRDVVGEAEKANRRQAALDWKQQDEQEKIQQAMRDERRYKQLQIKDELQIGELEGFDDTMLDPDRQKQIMEQISQGKGSTQADQKKHHQPNQQQMENPSCNNPHTTQAASASHVIPVGSSLTYPHARNEIYTQPNNIPSTQPQLNVPVQVQQDQFNYQVQPGHQRQHDQGHYPYQSESKHHEHFNQQPTNPQLQWDQSKQQHQLWQQQQQQQQLERDQQLRDQHWQHQQYGGQQQQWNQQRNWNHQPQQEQQRMDWQQQPVREQQQLSREQQQWEQQQYQKEHQRMDWQQQQQQREQPVGLSTILRAEEDTINTQHPAPPERQYSNADSHQRNPHVYEEMPGPPLTEGSLVLCGDNPTRYGVIKWIGYLPGSTSKVAGVELEKPIYDSVNNDGTFDKFQYFNCQPGHGLFVTVTALRPDLRFSEPLSEKALTVLNPLGEFQWGPDDDGETFYQALKDVKQHEGLGKGIQGHQNSCYLDSTLYGMFSYSEVFDDLVLKKQTTDLVEISTKKLLRQIVNLLRRRGVVHYNAIMSLRTALDKLQQLKGLKSEEKDPEEFLNLLFKHVLHVEAFLKIRRPSGEDKEYFVQLFVEQDKNNIPSTQHLLCDMFLDQNISFVKYPLRLLLQIPRYGKQFKSFKGVIPSLELDISVLCEEFAGKCFICAQPGEAVCGECNKDEFKNKVQYFCKRCFIVWHQHPERQHHKLIPRRASNTETGRLQLLSVLCIETSHYVCFTRVTGYGKDEWVFFDSMAERPDDVHNMPKVTVCTDDLNEWVYGNKDLTQYSSKDLPPLVRRFVEDGYLCIYVDHDGIMYGDEA